MSDFKDPAVWRRSRRLTATVYEATKQFPSFEERGIVSQLRRACVSIGSNIAEGSARHSRRDQTRYYRTSLASAREVESLLLTALDVGYLTPEQHAALGRAIGEIQRMLSGLVRYTKSEGWGNRKPVS